MSRPRIRTHYLREPPTERVYSSECGFLLPTRWVSVGEEREVTCKICLQMMRRLPPRLVPPLPDGPKQVDDDNIGTTWDKRLAPALDDKRPYFRWRDEVDAVEWSIKTKRHVRSASSALDTVAAYGMTMRFHSQTEDTPEVAAVDLALCLMAVEMFGGNMCAFIRRYIFCEKCGDIESREAAKTRRLLRVEMVARDIIPERPMPTAERKLVAWEREHRAIELRKKEHRG